MTSAVITRSDASRRVRTTWSRCVRVVRYVGLGLERSQLIAEEPNVKEAMDISLRFRTWIGVGVACCSLCATLWVSAFQSCSAATFSYSFTAESGRGLSGVVNLSRVGPVPPGCVS
jgi:hypothetical protein